ncbi:PRD domain-containing protein [Staphylococcus chromogenes]|nr:transcription antiterminator BglG [Staphylococcus chromogenes]PTG72300.1 transcription antiterminator BglG [Staphylococcus chromogenes]RIM05023.1 PRD domain-containing protein [Staphylococcus chromogenes]
MQKVAYLPLRESVYNKSIGGINLLSNRQHQILNRISNVSQFVTTSQLAKEFNLSERTIQYDIEYLEAMSETLGYRIVRSKSEGVKAFHEKNETDINGMNPTQIKQYHFSKDERLTLLKLILLEQERPLSSKTLAEELRVSRRTIASDIKEAIQWFEVNKLAMTYIKNKGFIIKGEESDYRNAYAQLLHRYYEEMNDAIIAHFNGTEDLKNIRKLVIKVLKNEEYQLVQTAIEGLILHLFIAIKRLKQNYPLPYTSKEDAFHQVNQQYQVAIKLKTEIEHYFNIEFPDSEVELITLHLLASKQSTLNVERHHVSELEELISQFVERLSFEMGIEFFTDHKLIQGLSIYLSPAIYRMQNQLNHINPLHEDIVNEYRELIDMIQKHVTLFENHFDIQFNAHEISYLTLHFASSFERLLNRKRKQIKVILLCGSGVGTSQLLNAKLTNIYPEFDIIEAYSIYEIDEVELMEMNVDMVISTVPTQYKTIKSITVSPLLTQEDIKKLNHIINSKRVENASLDCTSGVSLSEILTDSRIFEISDKKTFEEAITQTVYPLEQDGIVLNTYKDEIMNKLHELGPYMVIGPHIALIHGSTTHVKGVGMSLGYFKKGVVFNHDRFDPVKIIVCLATENTNVHLKALKQLSELLFRDEIRNQLINGQLEDFKKNIRKMEGK